MHKETRLVKSWDYDMAFYCASEIHHYNRTIAYCQTTVSYNIINDRCLMWKPNDMYPNAWLRCIFKNGQYYLRKIDPMISAAYLASHNPYMHQREFEVPWEEYYNCWDE